MNETQAHIMSFLRKIHEDIALIEKEDRTKLEQNIFRDISKLAETCGFLLNNNENK